jgi:hypothetical protein
MSLLCVASFKFQAYNFKTNCNTTFFASIHTYNIQLFLLSFLHKAFQSSWPNRKEHNIPHAVGLHAIKKAHNKVECHQDLNVKAHDFEVLREKIRRMWRK